jgi:hypothetical protein
MEDPNEEQAIVLEWPQCGHTEYQPLIIVLEKIGGLAVSF